jgi:UDP-N-acetyl-D-mannosaminuronic acid dehydrogenase
MAGTEPLPIAVVGGGGHVGLPLSLALAEQKFPVTVIDQDAGKIEALKRGQFPFLEEGGQELLVRLLESNHTLCFTVDPACIATCQAIVLVVGTPVDEHMNPDLKPVYGVIDQIRPFLRDGQVLILRSTLFPGTSEKIRARLEAAGLKVGVCFCPERIAQGHALKELREFPQIISGSDDRALAVARQIFSVLTPKIIELSMTEAELAKLFTNAWRYIKFAVANQFYMIAIEKGLDFYRIREAMMRDYERAADFPRAGFAAGPCLFKDTMQLAAYNRQHFPLGHSAMLLNETLPDFLVEQAKLAYPLKGMRVGILGMAFKADNDDKRESLAYKLRRLLLYENAVVLCTDPYIKDSEFVPLETVLASCPLIFIGCPHEVYRSITFDKQEVIDCWGIVSR